jgi:hypothetical protein
MIFQGIDDCAKANCTFFEENYKLQEIQNTWLGRFVTFLDEDCLISNIVRPIFYFFSYFKDASDALKQGINPISLTNALATNPSKVLLQANIRMSGQTPMAFALTLML